MKPAICVVSHPNTLEKEYILKDFGNFISQYKIDHYLFSNFPAHKDTQKEFTGCYYTSNNPEGPFKGIIWREFKDFNAFHYKIINNWCLSGTNCLLEGVKILKALGYTHFIFFSYDCEPNLDKIKNIIDNSLIHLKNYKGVFYDYNQKGKEFENSLSTTQCACEIEFFIKVFDSALNDYSKAERSLCEPFWFDVLKNYPQETLILPDHLELKGIINSGKTDQINNVNFWLGYSPEKDQTILSLQFPFLNSIKLYKEEVEINFEEIQYDNTLKVIYFKSEPFSKYYISYNNMLKEFLFEDIPSWRSHNYYKFING